MSEIGRLGGRRSAGRRASAAKPDVSHSATREPVVAEPVEPTNGHPHVNHENSADSHAHSQAQPT
jgi:hypothetical protein